MTGIYSFIYNVTAAPTTDERSAKVKLDICRSCPYVRDNEVMGVKFNSCGKFPSGETIERNGRPVKLCGCVMDIKTLLPVIEIKPIYINLWFVKINIGSRKMTKLFNCPIGKF